MNVISWKLKFFKELKKKFPDTQSSIEKGLTSIGFKNNFEQLKPKPKEDSVIIVYKNEEDCEGTPCNNTISFDSSKPKLIQC